MEPFDFENRSVLVTGGTSGIGAGIARAFAGAGADVVAVGLEVAAPAGGGADHAASSGGLSVRSLDVTDAAAVAALVAGLERLDVLVNCAGIIRRDRELELEEFAHVIDVNLTGTMRACVAAHDLLARAGGCVLNVASMYSFFGAGHAPAYSASKGGVAQLTRSLAIRWAREGIRVNAIAPGWIDTPFTQGVRADRERERRMLERTPLGRWGTTGDVVGAALFLCSPLASFITGTVLPVDGGYSVY